MPQGQLKFKTAMIDFATGKEVSNITAETVKDLGIESFIPTGDPQKDNLKQVAINQQILDRKDEFPKVTFADILNQLFDIIKMPSNSDFEIYATNHRYIRDSKVRNEESVTLFIKDLEKLKKLFSMPPKEHLNKKCAFLTETLEAAIITPIVNQSS